jgi:regulator of replication initiation timing
MGFSLLVTLLYVYWLLRDRTRRLDVSVTLLTQISNAYLDARDHALDAIEKHNQLADDYNALAERMAATDQQKTENQKRVRRDAKESVPEDFGGGGSTEAEARSDRSAPPEVGAELLLQQRRDADAQAGRRFAQQISALQEKNKTLRTSLNEALTDNERLKREKAETRGA